MRGLLGPLRHLLFLFFLGQGLLCFCVAGWGALEHFILSRGCALVLDRTFRHFLWCRSEFLLNPLHRIPIASGGAIRIRLGESGMTYDRRLSQRIPGYGRRLWPTWLSVKASLGRPHALRLTSACILAVGSNCVTIPLCHGLSRTRWLLTSSDIRTLSTTMLTIGAILYVSLLLINAVAVLSEDRFLARSVFCFLLPRAHSSHPFLQSAGPQRNRKVPMLVSISPMTSPATVMRSRTSGSKSA